MKTPEILLQHNCPLRIEGGGTTLECVAGTVWLTNALTAGDVFLRPGERHRLAAGLTLIEALGTASIVLHPRASRWQRIISAARSSFLLSSLHEHTLRRWRIHQQTPLRIV